MIGKSIYSDIKEIAKLYFSKEVFLNIFMSIVWASVLVEYAWGLIARLPLIGDYVDVVMVLVWVVPFVLAVPSLQRKVTLLDLFLLFCLYFLYLINYLVYPENEAALEGNAFVCLCTVFPYYLIGRILNIEKYYKLFLFISILAVFFNAFYMMYYVRSTRTAEVAASVLGEDNMYAAYKLLPHVALVFWAMMRKFNILLLPIGLLGTVLLISCGSRGPVASLAVFIVGYFFLLAKFKYSIYVKSFIVLLCIVCATFAVETALMMKNFFSELGLSTRIVDRFLNGGLGHDTGRSDLRRMLYDILDESNSFFGYGLFGSQRYGIIYAHNIFCDFFFTFGYIVGGILLLALFSLVAYAFMKSWGTMRQQFLFVLIVIVLFKMLLSATFTLEPMFYLLIGYCVKICYDARQQENAR